MEIKDTFAIHHALSAENEPPLLELKRCTLKEAYIPDHPIIIKITDGSVYTITENSRLGIHNLRQGEGIKQFLYKEEKLVVFFPEKNGEDASDLVCIAKTPANTYAEITFCAWTDEYACATNIMKEEDYLKIEEEKAKLKELGKNSSGIIKSNW